MGCNCKTTELVLGILVIVFAFLPQYMISKWVVVVSGAVLVIHALMCKGVCSSDAAGMSADPKKFSKKKKRR